MKQFLRAAGFPLILLAGFGIALTIGTIWGGPWIG
jgi:hypothetical protein